MAVQLTPFTKSQWFDAAGNPLSGGKLFTFQAGTSINQASFTDSTGSVQNANPVILDSAGRADVWLTAGLTYKLVLQNSAGTQLWSEDNINPALIPGNLTATNVAGNLTITQPVAATGGANQSSNIFEIDANYWTGAASALDKWTLQDVLGTGSNPTSTFTLTHSGSSGVATIILPTIQGVVTNSINVNPLILGGNLYPCNNTGLQAALAVVNLTGGDVDARGCSGTLAIAAFTLGASGGDPVRLLVGPSTWNMSGSITMNRGSSIIGTDNQSNNFNWTTDISGIITPTGTTGGLIRLENLSLNNQSLATAANAVALLQDCPRCNMNNVIVSVSSSAASAGIRLKAVTSNNQFGTWQGNFTNVTIQRGGLAGRSTTVIGLDMQGNSAITNGAISLWSFTNMWIENQNLDIVCNLCTDNTWYGGNIYSANTVQVQITGNGTVNSNGNAFFNTTFNQVGLAGATNIVTLDGFSNNNYISGVISGPTSGVYISDAGSKNIHAVMIDTGTGVDFNYGGVILQSNNYAFNEIGAGARIAGIAGQDILSGDSLNHGILASFNGGSFTNNYLLAANTAQTIPATFTFTGNQIFGTSSISGTTGIITKYNNIVTTGNGVASVLATTGAVATGSGASIAATSLCSTAQCPAGTYLVHAYLDITSACATTGGYIVWLGYTDDGGAKTGSSVTTFIPINGLGTTPATGSLALASTTNYGQGTAVVRTTGAATGGLGSINYGTTATACGSGGPMVGKLYLDVTRLE